MDIQEAKKFTIQTIRTGSKERIAEVVKRYFKLRKSAEVQKPDIIDIANKVFNEPV